MRMTLLTAAALGLTLASGAWANPGEHGGDRHERHMDRMAERLDLTDSQRAQVEALMKQHHERTADAREQIKKSHEQVRTEIRALLNEDQIAKMEKMHKGKGKGKGRKDHEGH
ncbi:MAG: periplasmic heavy metal sensor [Gammaproteobacteria bacterium]